MHDELKRRIAIMAAGALGVGVAACGGASPRSAPAVVSQPAPSPVASPEPEDDLEMTDGAPRGEMRSAQPADIGEASCSEASCGAEE